ncbi:MAG: putative transcriptional regulator, partial [Gammaproteobacteria bacterium]
MTITDFIINDIKPIQVTENTGEVQAIFSQTTYSHVPIAEGENYIGSLAENDAHCFDAN